jgi:hypothetical protein
MWGITAVLAGTKKDLGMSQDDLSDLITEHGGQGTKINIPGSLLIIT